MHLNERVYIVVDKQTTYIQKLTPYIHTYRYMNNVYMPTYILKRQHALHAHVYFICFYKYRRNAEDIYSRRRPFACACVCSDCICARMHVKHMCM